MMSKLQAAWVIARRDFTATVMSRTFILFLIFPVLIIGLSVGVGAMTAKVAQQESHTRVAVIAAPGDYRPLDEAREHMKSAFGDDLAELVRIDPDLARPDQVKTLLASKDQRFLAVLSGFPDHLRLTGSIGQDGSVAGQIRAVLDRSRHDAALAKAGVKLPPAALQVVSVDESAGSLARGRAVVAQGAQTLLFMATVMLASMVLSNMIEEKSNKVIEVLASAISVDSVFFGKLGAMLAVSLLGIAVWMTAGVIASELWPSNQGLLPVPAVGWPVFLLLGFLYFSMNYLLLGALFLGIGSQAGSVREVQTVSMPVTIGQVIIFIFATAAARPVNGPLGIGGAIFPFSSPLVMMARAAQTGELWPHLVALVWQGLWVWLIVRLGSALFRAHVLKSGGGAAAALGLRRRSRA
jgi:ABC-2 type transport system permease protein